MVSPMRACPVCGGIVMLSQETCTICGHDLSLPAPPGGAADEGVDDAIAGEPIDPAERPQRLPRPDPPREGVSPAVVAAGVGAVAVLLALFLLLTGGDDDPEAATAPSVPVTADPLAEVLGVCRGTVVGLESAADRGAPAPRPAVFLIGDVGTGDVVTEVSAFPETWQVDPRTDDVGRAAFVVCANRRVGVERARCPFGVTDEPLVRFDADYRVAVYAAATGELLAQQTIGAAPFGECPVDAPPDGLVELARPDPGELYEIVLPLIAG